MLKVSTESVKPIYNWTCSKPFFVCSLEGIQPYDPYLWV